MCSSIDNVRKNSMISITAVLVLCFGWFAAVQAEEEKAETVMGKLAASMKPGEWKLMETKGLTKGLTLVTKRKLSILGWGDNATWDPNTRQLLFMGFRLSLKFIAYSEEENKWRELPTFKWPLKKSFGHPYGNNAINRKKGVFYHHASASPFVYAFDIREEKWSRLPTCPFKAKGCGWAIEYFPEMDAILFPYASGQVYKLDMKKEKWSVLQKGLSYSLHPFIRHNAKHGVVLLGGGNDRERNLFCINADGKIKKMAKTPVDIHVRSTKIVEDPVTGDFLVLQRKKFYAYCINRDKWAPLDDPSMKPPSYDGSLICAPVPEHGVSMWMAAPRYQTGRVWLFKYKRPEALKTD